jgi:hypothetical protein
MYPKNVARLSALIVSAFAATSLVIACSSSSTSGTSTGDGGSSSNGGEGGSTGGGGGACKLADGTYLVHSTAKDNADGGFGCSAPPDQTVSYPVDASSDIDAGGSAKCTTMTDSASCTLTITCMSGSGNVMSTITTVQKINADGKGYTTTEHLQVTSGGQTVTDCDITSTATPQ